MPPAAGEQEGSELGTLGGGAPQTRQEDCVPLLPVPRTGFPLLNSYHYDILVAESH